MNNNSSNITRKPNGKKPPLKLKPGGVVALTVLAICVVLIVAKGLFSSNNTDIPAGIYTGTINTNQAAVAPEVSSTDDSSADASSAADENSEDDSSVAEEKAYVTEYANLHTEPSKDAEDIVCMSPNVEVTVLEKLDNGYWKIFFVNIDGPTTGYLWSGYLQPTPLY